MKNTFLHLLIKILFLFIISISWTWTSVSQNTHERSFYYQGNQRVDTRTHVVRAWYNVNSHSYTGTPENVARRFITDNMQALGVSSLDNLELMETKRSAMGNHIVFKQKYRNIPVFGSETVISINNNNQVTFVVNGYNADINLTTTTPAITLHEAISTIKNLLHVQEQSIISRPSTELTIVKDSLDVFHVAWLIRFVSGHPDGCWQSFVDALSGIVIFAEDISARYETSARVFKPDPVSKTQNVNLVDNNNAEDTVLFPAYATVTLTLDDSPPAYTIQGQYAHSEQLEPDTPEGYNNKVPLSTTPSSLEFLRSDDVFEEVNAYYFITQEREYIGNLPYGFLLQLKWHDKNGYFQDYINFDAHGRSGTNYSHYVPSSTNGTYIAFSDLGVDDAEDLGVIIHEYGHAIHDALLSGIGWGTQEKCISEGTADYMAISYRRTLSQFQPDIIAPWDGNAQEVSLGYGTDRHLEPTYRYDTHWGDGSNEYLAGTVWASTMMDMECQADIGRDITHVLLLNSFPQLNYLSLVVDQISSMFQVDRDYYNSTHFKSIGRVFYNRGFFL